MENISMEPAKKMILGMGTYEKLALLKQAQEDKELGIFTQILNIILEAPLNEGGVSSDLIQKFLKD